MAHTVLICEGCHRSIHKYDDYVEVDHGIFYHYRCKDLKE